MNESERLLYNINDDLFDLLSGLNDIPERYAVDIMKVMITVAIESGDLDRSASMISSLKEKDSELAFLCSVDLEMKKGDHSKALSMIKAMERTGRPDVDLRAAGALGHLGRKDEAMELLDSMKDDIVKEGTVDGLDRVYIQMADVCSVSNDHDSEIKYLTKALGVAADEGKRRIYGLLAASYETIGMSEKAKEYYARSRIKISCSS